MTILATNRHSVRAGVNGWQRILKDAFRSPAALCQRLGIASELALTAFEGQPGFRLFAPEPFVSKMRPGDPYDPLFRQVWPASRESDQSDARFVHDPVGDLNASLHPGLIQKYLGRALIIVTGSCAIHCRYCFRRHFAYEESRPSQRHWDASLDAIRDDTSIEEVILSGGDPLTVVDSSFSLLLDAIDAIKHVRRVRIHTRLPIVLPQRITQSLLDRCACSTKKIVVVLHSNHPNEIDDLVRSAVFKLISISVTVLNQAVLLSGINDSVDVQCRLSESLIDCGVVPYYLHQLDRVAGGRHFEVAEEKGVAIIDEMRRRMPGYMVPKYVREVAGYESKLPLG